MVGIQCYPISLKLEGPDAVLQEMKTRVGADAALLCVNEVECPEVFDTLKLPHQKDRTHFRPTGEYCFEPDPSCYAAEGMLPVSASDTLLKSLDAVGAFVDSSQRSLIKSFC